MALLGSLQVRLGLDTGVFSGKLTKFSKDAKGITAGINKGFLGMVPTKAILGGLAGIASGLSAISFARVIQEANNLTDTLRDQSIRLGIGVSDLQAFQLAAGNAGIESGKLSSLLGKLNKSAGEIKIGEGNQKTVEAFRRIGLSVEEVRRSNPAELFTRVIEGLGGIQDPAARAATSMAIFGKSGQDALTLVADGAGSLTESRRLLDELGLSLSQINADNVDAANDALGTLGFLATAAKQKLGAELAPQIVRIAAGLMTAGQNGLNMGQGIEMGVAKGVFAFEKLFAAGQYITGLLNVARLKASEYISMIYVDLSSFAESVVELIGSDVPRAFSALLEAGEKALTNLEQGFRDFGTSIANAVIGAMNAIIKSIEGMVNKAVPALNKVIAAANKANPFGGTIPALPTASLGTISPEGRTKVKPYDFGSSDINTFGGGTRDFLQGLQDDFGRNQFSYAADAAQAAEDTQAAWDRLWSNESGVLPPKPMGDLAEELKQSTTYANDLAAALGGSGASGGAGGSGGGVSGALDEVIPKARVLGEDLKFTGLEVANVWTESMGAIGSAIDEFVETGKLNFKDLGNSILQSIASASIKGAINYLATAFASATGGGENSATGTGWIGSFLNTLGSFEGGGYTGSGPRTGGLDGRGGRLAMVHPNETVIDHEKVRAGSRSRRGREGVNLTVPITLMPGVSKQELAEILPLLKRDIIQTIPALITRGGRYAAAYGQ